MYNPSSFHQGESINPEDFTFEKFYEFYSKICPRNYIEELFRDMYVVFKWYTWRSSSYIDKIINYELLFSSTQGLGENITVKQFVEFLNAKQRDPRLNEILYPLYDNARALEIINDYEDDPSLSAKGAFSRHILPTDRQFWYPGYLCNG